MAHQKSVAVADLVVTEVQAKARVNRLLLSQIGSQFCTGEPDFDMTKNCWRVPVLLVTPGLIVGQVGEAWVNPTTREILSHPTQAVCLHPRCGLKTIHSLSKNYEHPDPSFHRRSHRNSRLTNRAGISTRHRLPAGQISFHQRAGAVLDYSVH